MIDISVVIVSYNTRELLEQCLKSVMVASQSLDTEIFVVDNNSHDDTVQYIKKDFPHVKLIANKTNLGFSKANNIALKKINGKYALILNPDTKLETDTLIKMKSFLDGHDESVAMATCRVELENGKLDSDCRRHFPTPWSSFSHFSGLSKIFPRTKLFDSYYMGYLSADSEHEIDSCEGAFMFARTSALKRVGFFDEDYFFYGEDIDLCFRLKSAAYKVVYTPVTKILHFKGVSSGIKKHSKHISKSTKESKLNALKESTRAMKLFYKKHYEKTYPFFINWAMYTGIWLLGKQRTLK